jgi:radical SAM protein with 4Fe4S-binding SPASM domain
VDYLKYKPVFLDTEALLDTVMVAGRAGVKSIMYAGEGEPLLHKDIGRIITETKKAGIDVSLTTNGVLLKKELSSQILRSLSWVRISLNAGSAHTYAAVHRCRHEDFDKVLDNLSDAVAVKKSQGLKTTIGAQLLLIPQNADEVVILAKKIKRLGLDYLTVKPYSQHPLSGSKIARSFRYRDHLGLDKALRRLEDYRFKVIFRTHTMERLSVAKEYRHCLGLPFWAYIDAKGDVYACSAFLGKKDFCFGNIYKKDFNAIMSGQLRRTIIKRACGKLDISQCRLACRLDKINSYLWELKHPGPHVNFI